MSDPRSPTDDSDLQEKVSRLRRQRAALSAEVERLQGLEPGRLRARVVKMALIVGLLALAASGAVYQFRSWVF